VAAGCGLRQCEAVGLRVSDIDFLRQRLRVEQEVKIVRGRLVIDRPKGGNTRTVPLAEAIAFELSEHLRRYPAAGDELVFRSRERKPIKRNYFNRHIWRPRGHRRRRRAAAMGYTPSATSPRPC
jgi:integrase